MPFVLHPPHTALGRALQPSHPSVLFSLHCCPDFASVRVTHLSIHYLMDLCFASNKGYFIQPSQAHKSQGVLSFLSHLAMVSQRPVSEHLRLDPLWKIKNSGCL